MTLITKLEVSPVEQRILSLGNGNTVVAKTQFGYDDSGYELASSGELPTAAANSWVDPKIAGEDAWQQTRFAEDSQKLLECCS